MLGWDPMEAVFERKPIRWDSTPRSGIALKLSHARSTSRKSVAPSCTVAEGLFLVQLKE